MLFFYLISMKCIDVNIFAYKCCKALHVSQDKVDLTDTGSVFDISIKDKKTTIQHSGGKYMTSKGSSIILDDSKAHWDIDTKDGKYIFKQGNMCLTVKSTAMMEACRDDENQMFKVINLDEEESSSSSSSSDEDCMYDPNLNCNRSPGFMRRIRQTRHPSKEEHFIISTTRVILTTKTSTELHTATTMAVHTLLKTREVTTLKTINSTRTVYTAVRLAELPSESKNYKMVEAAVSPLNVAMPQRRIKDPIGGADMIENLFNPISNAKGAGEIEGSSFSDSNYVGIENSSDEDNRNKGKKAISDDYILSNLLGDPSESSDSFSYALSDRVGKPKQLKQVIVTMPVAVTSTVKTPVQQVVVPVTTPVAKSYAYKLTPPNYPPLQKKLIPATVVKVAPHSNQQVFRVPQTYTHKTNVSSPKQSSSTNGVGLPDELADSYAFFMNQGSDLLAS